MATTHRTASSCRACGLDGRAYYVTVLGHRVPLCTGCTTTYLNAETACDVRANEREREARERAARRYGVRS